MIWTTFLWVWSHLAFVSALAGLGVVWFIWPRFALVGVPVAVLIAVSAFLGAFGWGELRYLDGREDATAGIIKEAEKAKREAETKLADLETEMRETEREIRLSNDPVIDNLRKQLRDANSEPVAGVSLQDELDIARDTIASLEAANQALADDKAIPACAPKTIIKHRSCLKAPVPQVAIDAWKAIR